MDFSSDIENQMKYFNVLKGKKQNKSTKRHIYNKVIFKTKGKCFLEQKYC